MNKRILAARAATLAMAVGLGGCYYAPYPEYGYSTPVIPETGMNVEAPLTTAPATAANGAALAAPPNGAAQQRAQAPATAPAYAANPNYASAYYPAYPAYYPAYPAYYPPVVEPSISLGFGYWGGRGGWGGGWGGRGWHR
jgi:hypothetical protein